VVETAEEEVQKPGARLIWRRRTEKSDKDRARKDGCVPVQQLATAPIHHGNSPKAQAPVGSTQLGSINVP
jgi:hypothetical protein